MSIGILSILGILHDGTIEDNTGSFFPKRGKRLDGESILSHPAYSSVVEEEKVVRRVV